MLIILGLFYNLIIFDYIKLCNKLFVKSPNYRILIHNTKILSINLTLFLNINFFKS